ncbi:hypothetical protein CCR75_009253 [Bremia lactucae]|uniref:HTH myb-type domain-containing protein n=1 Tax=Bremia lactucae TaxID=4779 RepID=A0A976IB99_BRELC|nr:hypothetical protein CCR75_009253 [Bremia lactucae]
MNSSKPDVINSPESDPNSTSPKWIQKRPTNEATRKPKRLLWTEELHMCFVSAVFELGVKMASPRALLDIMESQIQTEKVTTEHIKSHLQKYRIGYKRSRHELQTSSANSKKRSTKDTFKHARHPDSESTDSIKATNRANQCIRDSQIWKKREVPECEEKALVELPSPNMTQRQEGAIYYDHRLTCNDDVASDLSWDHGTDSLAMVQPAGRKFYNEQESSLFQANTLFVQAENQQAYDRLYPVQPEPEPVLVSGPSSHFTCEHPEPLAMIAVERDEGGLDLTSWSRLSLTVDPDEDELFDFLQS